MSGYLVKVTWMDGKWDSYIATDYPVTDKNGTVLHVVERYGVTGGVKTETHLTIANIREWRAEPR
jgi:hypothetical protein